MLGLYIHIPFCRRRCPYCDFVSEAIADIPPQPYVDALHREIDACEETQEIDSIFFGGGTPSLLSAQQLESLLTHLHSKFYLVDPEITLEANPDDVTQLRVDTWLRLGINRISLGVQSFSDAVLRYLGRRHDAATARRACDYVAARFENWNIDLIFGAPPLEHWRETLQETCRLSPPHVAAYGLTYEAGTPFERRIEDAIEDDASLQLYQQAEEVLTPQYTHYEISNYAKPGHLSRHNLHYWRNEAYLGLGTGAYEFRNGVRARNLSTTTDYIVTPGKKEEALCLNDVEIRTETLIQHFRLKEGISYSTYQKRFHRNLDDDFGPQLRQLVQRGLLKKEDDAILPTAQGFYLNNEIGLTLLP